ncbi:MAG: hypothetical protein COB54_02820 [Alphaproteobacteria bacterium]|nr:MAG: hypothetical protein COB54_02820 [Alphaproteobacteria bacterium]
MSKQIIEKINQLCSLESAVRKHINTTRYQNDLISDSDNWNQICCSLDTIGDTSYSISDYIESDYPSKMGLKYIYTYGLLQALIIQQDAMLHLSKAFKVTYKISEVLYGIRYIRNSAIGHPTKQNQGTPNGQTHFNYISRMTLSKNGFRLMKCYDQRKIEFLDVDLFKIIDNQLDEIKSGCEAIVVILKEADKMHKEKYKDDLLINIFHSIIGYHFEKIGEGIYSPNSSNIQFGLSRLKSVQKTYLKFENALKERGDLTSYTQYDLDEYKHALSMLEAYLEGSEHHMSESDARIYHFYMCEQHKHFEEIAKEVDATYASETQTEVKNS